MWKLITSNNIVNVGIVAFFSAQLIKTILTLIATRKLDLERLVGAGGMPSSHSSLTCSVAIALARQEGFDSPVFAVAVAFAAIVMYDAMGVRRAAGEQAKVLNKMIFEFDNFPFFFKSEKPKALAPPEPPKPAGGEEANKPLLDKELKEYLGHTPFEVLGGCLLGILVAVLMPVG